jgi:hypothetical protein
MNLRCLQEILQTKNIQQLLSTLHKATVLYPTEANEMVNYILPGVKDESFQPVRQKS